MLCASVRRKGDTDQCSSLALRGHTLCGRHAKSKVPTLWSRIHQSRNDRVVKFQALVRGWLVRSRLCLAGPGVLSRTLLVNDEELLTCEPKERHPPFDYVAFSEAGKVWWFDFSTLWKWCCQSPTPTNPYTKVPLSSETRSRLRRIWAYRQRNRLPLPEESTVYEQRLRSRWNVVCQVFTDHGFADAVPASFSTFGPSEFHTMFVLLERDIQDVFPDTDPGKARALRLCRRGIYRSQPIEPRLYMLWSVYTMLLLLTIHNDPYTMTFSVLSALYRC